MAFIAEQITIEISQGLEVIFIDWLIDSVKTMSTSYKQFD